MSASYGYMACSRCGMGQVVGPGIELTLLYMHECPEPFSRETAEHLLAFHSQTGIPVSSRTKARIALGLAQ